MPPAVDDYTSMGGETGGKAHLRAALALWRYSADSARLIFNQGSAEAEDPM